LIKEVVNSGAVDVPLVLSAEDCGGGEAAGLEDILTGHESTIDSRRQCGGEERCSVEGRGKEVQESARRQPATLGP